MEYVFGGNIPLAQQASNNVKLYRINREEQLNTLEYKIIKQLKNTILEKSLEEGIIKYTIDINRDFNFASLLSLKVFNLKSDEKERLKKAIINFLTKEDFNYEHMYSKLVVRWKDPEKTLLEKVPEKE